MKLVRNLLASAGLALVAPAALALPCAGFTDVDSTSAFCPNVEWIKNRGVTTGCTSSTLYCPTDSVSRLAMAAFMNRLGTALTPAMLRVDAAPGPVVLDSTPVVCQTTDFPATGFPRRVYVDLVFAGTAASAIDVGADLVQSVDRRNVVDPAHRPRAAAATCPLPAWGNLFANLAHIRTSRWASRCASARGSGAVRAPAPPT